MKKPLNEMERSMREILFRAKKKDSGFWVEGYYACESNHACFKEGLKYTHFIFEDEFMDWGIGGLRDYEVIPETVGQYTGLTDKNGKRIFENDIVNFDGKIYYIRYVDGVYRLTNSHHFYSESIHNWYSFFEVVGNIHDNPELLNN